MWQIKRVLCCFILNNRFGAIYLSKSSRMEKTDPTETKLINIWGGWAREEDGAGPHIPRLCISLAKETLEGSLPRRLRLQKEA